MELNHLRYFFEVAKAGSFTEAARKLRISQSALSKAVAQLEGAEGVKLFERSKRGVSLTPVGEDVYRMSAGIFQAVTEIENTCRGTKETCEGPMRFGASDHVANYVLVDRLQRMRAEYPSLLPSVFSGTPHEIVSLILAHELELGLFFTKVNVPGISYEQVASFPMAVVCHPRLLPKAGASSRPRIQAFLKEVGFITSIKTQYQHHPSQSFMSLVGESAPVVLESNSQETQKRFCLAGGGVAYLARFMVEKEIDAGKLVEIPMPKPLSADLLLAKRKGAHLSLSARTFLDSLRT